jgi:putative beta-lysine N-acetyltransferase
LLNIKHKGTGFYCSGLLEHISSRIWINEYSADDPAALQNFLKETAQREGMGKIILPVRVDDAQRLQGNGFVQEGMIEGYHSGSPAAFLSCFTSPERKASQGYHEEMNLLKEIISCSRTDDKRLPAGFTIRQAYKKDCAEMAALFKEVFASYPSPVFDPLYLARSMDKGDIYMAACRNQKVAAVAAAEIHWEQRRAEITNCATDMEFRGMGFNSLLIRSIQRMCLDRGIGCLYSLARASSYGMNMVLHRLGYIYRGTLVNNCHIAGQFEDMNIWVRPREEAGLLSEGAS